jgi:hypothetical protein
MATTLTFFSPYSTTAVLDTTALEFILIDYTVNDKITDA